MYAGGLGTERDEAAALSWLEKSTTHGNPYAQYQLDMLRRKIREKKIAMGHKLDDHEEQTQQFQ